MSIKHFHGAAEGQVPQQGSISAAMVLGKSVSATAALSIAALIGHGVDTEGRIEPTKLAQAANAAHFEKATPGGGLSATGDETVKYKYDAERNEALFMSNRMG
jgi:hypothetical protein